MLFLLLGLEEGGLLLLLLGLEEGGLLLLLLLLKYCSLVICQNLFLLLLGCSV